MNLMRWWVLSGVLVGAARYSPSSLPPSHETRPACYRPGSYATPSDRADYLQCMAHFMDEQQRAIAEHARAIGDAALRVQEFGLESR